MKKQGTTISVSGKICVKERRVKPKKITNIAGNA